nr:N-acetylmuramidase family protein [Geomonas sp. Red32]
MDRNPIRNATAQVEYGQEKKVLSSGASGQLPTVLTESPDQVVRLYLARLDGSLKQVTEVVSDWGNKLVTVISPKLKLEGQTKPHPKDASGLPVGETKTADAKPVKPPENPVQTLATGKVQAEYGDGKGPKTVETATAKGLPVCKVTNDQASLDFLKGFTGETITEEDYRNAAKAIGCEVEVIKAVAKIEGGKGFDNKNRPRILYERHVFSRNTSPFGRFNSQNPDISSNKAHRKRKKGEKVGDDIYGNSFPRLAKAYNLDKSAALKACSWGKFQILGEGHKLAGFKTVEEFVAAMCRSEQEHLKAFVNFSSSNKLLKAALISKKWEAIAREYNGKSYRKFNYDHILKEAYEKYAKQRH